MKLAIFLILVLFSASCYAACPEPDISTYHACTDKWWEEDSQNSRTLVLVSSVLLIAVGMITLLIKRKW